MGKTKELFTKLREQEEEINTHCARKYNPEGTVTTAPNNKE